MAALARLIEQHWRQPKWYLSWVLWPLARLFQSVVCWRRYWFQSGLGVQHNLDRPVVIVGNIHAGGVGKTPIVAALVNALQARGIRVGVISRGYGRQSQQTLVVNATSVATEVGDEPLMLFRQTKVPIAVGKTRLAAAHALLKAHPTTQLIISDDGLQHYALARAIEIAVFPAIPQQHRLDLLPNGPLREPVSRLNDVDVVVISQAGNTEAELVSRLQAVAPQPTYTDSHIEYGQLYCLRQPHKKANATDFSHKRCAAIAAIGQPERFFQALNQLNIDVCQTRILGDHVIIQSTDWPDAEVVFITEKDAVKLTTPQPNEPEIWVLPLKATLKPALTDMILAKLALKPI